MTQHRPHNQDGSDRPAPKVHFDSGQGERDYLFRSNVNYGTTESPQVHTAKIQMSPRTAKMLIIFILCSCLACFVFGYSANVPMNSALHERLRRLWATEENYRAITRQAWAVEVQKHENLRLGMRDERVAMDETRRKWTREREEQRDAMDQMRQDWNHEREEERVAMEETRQQWAREREKERVAMEEIRQQWEREREQERVTMDEVRRQWAREREQEQLEREKRARQAQEEEMKKRAGIAWEGLEAGHCVRYGVKEYTSTLSRVPLGFDSIEECQKKPISIQGREWLPSRCEESGFCGRVTGHWEVDINESSCKPWWVNYNDKGCVEYGIRRHDASLENLYDTLNWENICMTTPMTIHGRHYDGPTSCANWGRGGLWPWGIWLVEDDSCRL